MSPPKPLPPPKPAPLPSHPAPRLPPSLPPPPPVSQAPRSAAGPTPSARAIPSSIPAPIVPVPIDLVGSSSPSTGLTADPSAEEFYLKRGEEVFTMKLQEIQREVENGKIGPATLVCRVGDTEWRTVFDATELGLKIHRDEPSVTSVADTDLVFEELGRAATIERASPLTRGRQRVQKEVGKLTLVSWLVTGVFGLVVVLHQLGTLYEAASFTGMSHEYRSLEKVLLGGPGTGTVRGAEEAWRRSTDDEMLPFSKVQARVSQASRSGKAD